MSYLVDVNVLVYAVDADSEFHEAAQDWLDEQLEGPVRTVGLPWHTLLGFLRIVTHQKVPNSISMKDAWTQVQRWLALSACWIPNPEDRHREVLGEVLLGTDAAGLLVPDAHLVTLSIEHGLTVVSADRGFARFVDAGLVQWINPVA